MVDVRPTAERQDGQYRAGAAMLKRAGAICEVPTRIVVVIVVVVLKSQYEMGGDGGGSGDGLTASGTIVSGK